MALGAQMPGDNTRSLDFAAMTLVIVNGQRMDLVARLSGEACRYHGIEPAGEEYDSALCLRR